jgi:hypothetical protein
MPGGVYMMRDNVAEVNDGGTEVIRGTRMISIFGGFSVAILVATSGAALARGHGGEGNMWLLARAAGLSRDQIVSAFKSDSNLKADFANLQSARQAMVSCIVSGGSCTSQISSYSSAQQALTQEKMNVWQNLFKSAPNPKQASTVLSELEELHAKRRQIFQQVTASGSSDDTPK